MPSDQHQDGTMRVDTLDELELSVHHRITERPRLHETEAEIHAGHADVIEIPMPLVELAKSVTGVDIRTEHVRCGAEIQVVNDGE